MTAAVTAGPETATGPRYPAMDGLRALAASAVVLVHVGLITGFAARHADSVGPYIARAEMGVALFFLISGFLLYRPFVAAAFDGRPHGSLRTYARRRLLRIVPAYWAAVTILVLVLDVRDRNDIQSIGDAAIYYGFLQIYFERTALGGIQQAWSLCTELAFYVALPIWAVAIRWLADRRGAVGHPGRRVRVELAALAALYAFGLLTRWWVVRDLGPAAESIETRVNWLPTNADLFALGMAVAVLRAHADHAGSIGHRTPFTDTIGRAGGGWWWMAAAFSYWGVSTRAGIPVGVGADTPSQWMRRQVLYGSTALFLLLPAVFGPARRGLVRRGLQAGPVAAVGLVSYGVYLWHEGLLDLWRRSRDLTPFVGWFPSNLAVCVLGAAVAATVSWFAVEKPVLARK